MKKFFILFVFFFLGTTGIFAVNLQWTGVFNSSWNNPTNWSPVKLPDAGDNVTISASAINMPVVDAGIASCYNLTVNLGASLTINPGCILNVEGQVAYSGNLTVHPSGECVFNAGFNVTASANIQVNGNLRFGGISGAFTGNGTINGGGTVTVMPSRTIEMNAYLVVNTSFSHTGIININGSRTLTVNGSFDVSGTAQLNLSTTGSGGLLVLGGNLNYSSASMINLQNNGILRFGSAGGSGTFTGSATVSGSGSVEVQGSHSLHIQGTLVINTSFNHSGYVEVHSFRTLVVNGSFTATGSASLTVGSGGNGGVFETAGSFTWGSATAIQVSNDGIFRFGGSGSLNLSSDLTFNGSGSVEIAVARTVNVSGTVNVNCNLSHSGILNIQAGRTFTVSGNLSVSGSAQINVSTTGLGGMLVVGGDMDYTSSQQISLQNNGILRFGTIVAIIPGTFTGTATVNTSGSGSVEIQSGFTLNIQ